MVDTYNPKTISDLVPIAGELRFGAEQDFFTDAGNMKFGPMVETYGLNFQVANPVDIMTRVTYELSGFNSNRVFGTGTTLDTARLRYLLGDYFTVDPRNVHAYVIGEHGDSEFVPWSQAMVATKSVLDICEHSDGKFCLEEMQKISLEVRDAAQKIIEAKRATYYGIGMSLVRIVRAVLSNENSVLTVSARLRGEYGQRDVFAGVPCIVNRNGVDRVLELSLTEEERQKLADSCAILQENYQAWSCNRPGSPPILQTVWKERDLE